MRATFQYCEECPSHDQALERLRRILQQEGVRAEIDVIRVQTDEQAKRLRFLGSPTILLDGKDIDPSTTSHWYGVTCRAYRLEDGRISPLPSEEMIRQAVRATENFENHYPSCTQTERART